MFTPEAIEKIASADAVSEVTRNLKAIGISDSTIAVPSGIKIQDIENYLPERRRYRMSFSTPSLGAFLEYCNRTEFQECETFVDPDTMSAFSIFDIGTIQQPLHQDHTAHVKLKKTAELGALLDICNASLARNVTIDQRFLSEWIEEWRDHITAYHDEGPFERVAYAIAAVRNLDIKAVQNATSSVGNLSESSSVFTEAKVANPTFPTMLQFSCIPYDGLDRRTFQVRISTITGGDKARFILKVLRLDAVITEMAQELADKIKGSLISKRVYIGSTGGHAD